MMSLSTIENQPAQQKELDDIYALLAYSFVYRDWQPGDVPREQRRGYNIGAVLVDAGQQPVYLGLNSINSTNDATQHGELRAITGYLAQAKCFNLQGFTMYITLEPCVMCAGMMTMTALKRVVFGQHDVEYSKAFERLAMDTRAIGGFGPYPRQVDAGASSLEYCRRLDEAYHAFLQSESEKILAIFLASEEARQIYKDAYTAFINFNVRYKDNSKFYQEAFRFLNTFPHERTRK